MKTFRFTLIASIMTLTLFTLCGCQQEAPQVETSTEDMPWVVDRFDDIKVLRYEVPGFENLPLQQKLLVYYLAEAAKCGRDILFDQNFKYNLTVRRALEDIYSKYEGDRKTAEFVALENTSKRFGSLTVFTTTTLTTSSAPSSLVSGLSHWLANTQRSALP